MKSQTAKVPDRRVENILLLLSGGLDSTTAAYMVHEMYPDALLYAMSFSYEQRHHIGITQARRIGKRLEVKEHVRITIADTKV